MKILKTKKLEKNISDIQLELIMSKCLLNSDQTEYFHEWAKEKGSSVLSSTFLEPGDEEETPVDFNKTISDEVDYGSKERLFGKIFSKEAVRALRDFSLQKDKKLHKKGRRRKHQIREVQRKDVPSNGMQ